MANLLTSSETRLLAAAPARWRTRVERRELVAHVVLAAGFVGACAALIATSDAGSPPIARAIVLTLAFAALSRIEFRAGSGYTDPTQLVFVPMLFLVAPAWAPLLVALGLVAGRVPEIVARRVHVSRILAAPGNACYALGPALVFVLADIAAPALGDWPIYLLALVAQIAVDYASGAAGEWMSVGVAPDVQLRIMLPIWRIDLLLSAIGLMAAFAAQEETYAFLLVLPLGILLAVFAREHHARIEQAIELSSAYRNTALLLGDLVGDDDAYTGAHSQGVVALSMAVARRLDVGEEEQRLIELGALLHDVGKLTVPNEIINKPGPLDEPEWAIMRRHTVAGQEMLDRVGGALADVGEVVRSSHEWYDGSGYPDGRVAAATPRASRIIAVADAYSAMTTDRPYRRALPEAEAVRRLRASAGSQFDPEIVDALIAVVCPESRARPAAPTRVAALA